jgi:hypothetical protein
MRTINEHGNTVVTPVNNALTISSRLQSLVALADGGFEQPIVATRG